MVRGACGEYGMSSGPLSSQLNHPGLRLTTNYRHLNVVSQVYTRPIPHLYVTLPGLKGVHVVRVVEFCSGYGIMQSHAEMQPVNALVTRKTVIQPTGTTKGGWSSAANFWPCFGAVQNHSRDYIDDFVLYETSKEECLPVPDRSIQIFTERNLVIRILKSRLHAKVIEWHGREIDSQGTIVISSS